MKALIVYDSYFGNTEQVAREMEKSMKPFAEVNVLHVKDAGPNNLDGMDVLILGSPTRRFSPTPPIKEFLQKIPPRGLKGIKTAAFDTRIDVNTIKSGFLRFLVRTGGYAAKPLSRRLKRKGGKNGLPPAGFLVAGTEGPLMEGEAERAAAWVAGLNV
ncbi:MAG TPA: flavodoxin family protein [Bacteroidetes bacterium]|nr:flavodoxin family protein [Bacteroidota bacterium]